MTLDTIIWVSVALFVVHEFEEIVCIRSWLAKHQNDHRAKRQVFWSFRDTSTATIATLIFEEYLIFAGLAFAATLAGLPGMFAGLLVPYALHLVGHIFEAIRLRMHTPSVITSVLTLPWFAYAVIDLTARATGLIEVAVWSAVFTVVIAANFAFLYRFRPHLERHLAESPQR